MTTPQPIRHRITTTARTQPERTAPWSAAGKVQRWRLAPLHENGATPP
jgi:hypothetical protein